MGVHENIIAEQERLGIVPPLEIQHSRYLTCGTCGQEIGWAYREGRDGHRIKQSHRVQNQGQWNNGRLVYHHMHCPDMDERQER